MDNIKRVYCYAVCLVCLTIMLFGLIDISFAALSFVSNRQSAPSYQNNRAQMQTAPDAVADEYYKGILLRDRTYDGLSKIILPGIVFVYFSRKLKRAV